MVAMVARDSVYWVGKFLECSGVFVSADRSDVKHCSHSNMYVPGAEYNYEPDGNCYELFWPPGLDILSDAGTRRHSWYRFPKRVWRARLTRASCCETDYGKNC